MPRVRSPKRGSRSFSPRKRARSIKGRITYWPEVNGSPTLLAFAGYKAGMTHVFLIEDRQNSPDFGNEMKNAATVIDTPPMRIVGVRAYEKTYEGLKALTETWMSDLPVDILRTVKTRTGGNPENGFKNMAAKKDRIAQLRVIAGTQPRLTSVTVPLALEFSVYIGHLRRFGGIFRSSNSFPKLDKPIFDSGESLDVIGITTGRGFQGPVKRWGVRILQRKARKTKRGVASIGPWKPRRVMPGVPRAGQMGFHQRTEYNKRVILMGSDSERVTPKEGFNRYGEVRGDYLLVKGSVMGPSKRLIKLRKAIRRPKYPSEPPQVTYINTEFKRQGDGD